MKKLYKFCWDCNNGDLEGMFIAEEQIIKIAIGCEIYFGEVLGKHSEIYGTLEEGDLEIINVTNTTLEELENVFGHTICGYNPLDYI